MAQHVKGIQLFTTVGGVTMHKLDESLGFCVYKVDKADPEGGDLAAVLAEARKVDQPILAGTLKDHRFYFPYFMGIRG